MIMAAFVSQLWHIQLTLTQKEERERGRRSAEQSEGKENRTGVDSRVLYK